MTERIASADGRAALRYWRAVAQLPVDREAALTELAACFRAGEAPATLSGDLAGRLLATTLGHGLDVPFEALARVWMPWKGKALDAETAQGWNMFSRAAGPPMRAFWPRYREAHADASGRIRAFRFMTRVQPSAVSGDVPVLAIDYALPENPRIVRSILDELVAIDDGVCLGQALLRRGDALSRVAWFSLSGPTVDGASARTAADVRPVGQEPTTAPRG